MLRFMHLWNVKSTDVWILLIKIIYRKDIVVEKANVPDQNCIISQNGS